MAGALTLGGTIGGIVWRYLSTLKKEAPDAHVILERAEIADMSAMRELAREFKPALERLIHIDHTSAELMSKINKLLDIIAKMEQDARVAKEVREELARRTEELERWNRREHHRERE